MISPDARIDRDDLRHGLRDGFFWHRPEEQHDHLRNPDDWWAALRPLFLAAYDAAGVGSDLAERAADLVRSNYTDPGTWSIYQDTLEALQRVRRSGWHNMIVSNHVPELPELVEALGLAGQFRTVLTSATVGWEKPNPEFYRIALDLAEQRDEVRMIGDNPVADVAGAQAVGIPALLVRAPDPVRGERTLDQALDSFLPSEADR